MNNSDEDEEYDEDDEDYEQQLLNVNLTMSKIPNVKTLINGNENINPVKINNTHDLHIKIELMKIKQYFFSLPLK